ncbi:NAD(P)H-dependent oxidoreductase [Paenibacillus sp. GCM10027627]|uniref:NAD(P)H-dependent oxidoreductase n=1 Tax=unclassified Paenibacillus TaxID=185978 RepID=UPI0036411493
MNHLIVYAHPHEGSFNQAILDTTVRALQSNGHQVDVRDLYKLKFNPILSAEDTASMRAGNIPADIKAEQDFVSQADFITFIYPIWWAGLPAIIKGYADRVFSYGFAYQFNDQGELEQLLAGKKGAIINTFGTPEHIYEATGMNRSIKQTSQAGIFEFCGIETVKLFHFGGVTTVATDETRKEMLVQVEEAFKSF